MKKSQLVFIAIVVMLLASVLTVPLAVGAAECNPIPAQPIPPGQLDFLIQPWERYMGGPATPNPVAHVVAPQNPYMAPNGMSNMHNDSYMTDAYEVGGPLGLATRQMRSAASLMQLVVTITFDSFGRMVAVKQGADGQPHLLLMDPDTLDTLASYDLPARPYPPEQDVIPLTEDPSGGVYFYLDNKDRVVVTTNDYRLLVIKLPPLANPCVGFNVIEQYDLSANLATPPEPPAGKLTRDKMGPALPDWGGGYYWFSTRYGSVGVVNQEDGKVKSLVLEGEQIQNSPAVGEDGFYVVTDHAMYRFTVGKKGNPVMQWRTEYDRGNIKRPGMITQGSGTTPTLLGDLVVIADNADPLNVLFLRRDSGQVVAEVPVFAAGASCTENSLIGVLNADGTYSVIVENNYGYVSLYDTLGGKTTVGGVARVDAVPDAASPTGFSGHIEWTSAQVSATCVPKMSLANGLVYLYTKPPNLPAVYYPPPYRSLVDRWYFTAVDFQTGATVYSVMTGEGPMYNNNWAPITLGPDGRTVYVGCLGGLVSMRDPAT
ncbi:MAG TPA: hypothetical protein VN415_07285 [Dehalococcoidia bacterium]|nr:hypothetical protein [Dehalococcoidia bacterium]